MFECVWDLVDKVGLDQCERGKNPFESYVLASSLGREKPEIEAIIVVVVKMLIDDFILVQNL